MYIHFFEGYLTGAIGVCVCVCVCVGGLYVKCIIETKKATKEKV